jgi:hypothetical protein
MRQLSEQIAQISFRADGEPPETYELMLNTASLVRVADGGLSVRQVHRCTVYLHDEYPRRPPVVTWSTPIFHPNILGPERNGGVCIGSWSAGESLADLVRRLLDLVSYRSFNADEPLDREAAAVVHAMGISPGDDLRRVLETGDGAIGVLSEVAVRWLA